MASKRVGRYELGRTLGEGTFAKVKFATDVESQTHYAVKVFNRDEMSRELQRQIKEEIAIIKHVRHPNVVNLREVLASRTHVYVVLELVTGGELFDKVATAGKLEEKHARVYFQQLIDGVAYCHERRVCHRDLKVRVANTLALRLRTCVPRRPSDCFVPLVSNVAGELVA